MPLFKLDDRTISVVLWKDSSYGPERLSVGEKGITKITHHEQCCGDMGSIQWIEFWKGKKLYGRANAANIDTILYEEGEDDDGAGSDVFA